MEYKENLNIDFGWLDPLFRGSLYLGSVPTPGDAETFEGSISCLQFFDYALDEPTMTLKKQCQDLPDSFKTSPCPVDYEYYDHWCYKFSPEPGTYGKAEIACLPGKDDPYDSQVMFSENPRHWAHVGKLLRERFSGTLTYWAGFTDRAKDGFATTSFGENITLAETEFLGESDGFDACGIAGNAKGFLATSPCDEEYHHVCSRKPNYAAPNFRCPLEFYPWQGKCIHPDFQTMNYDDAVIECAKRGSILAPIKDIEMHSFLREWASTLIGSDVWFGMRLKRWSQYYDDSPGNNKPLQEVIEDELTHSDGEPFDPKIDYNIGLKKWKGDKECYFLKATEDYEVQGTVKTKEKSFFCLWQEYECPDEYKYIGQVSDGRTCHGFPDSEAAFDQVTCKQNDDFLRKRWMPGNQYQIDRIRREFVRDFQAVWTPAQVSILGQWTLDNETKEEMFTDQYFDMRRQDAGTWLPDAEFVVETLNQTGFGCLEVSSNGLLSTKLGEECQDERPPSCEYTACMTNTGKKCLFPYRYFNDSHPELQYKICSSLDVYRPWCPTKLDEQGFVLEWGDCLPDCPSEPPNTVCLEEPEFPLFADGTDHAVNYTSNYTRGSEEITIEVIIRESYLSFKLMIHFFFSLIM